MLTYSVLRPAIAATLLTLLSGTWLGGQSSNGSITGEVRDGSGLPVPAATITLRQANTGQLRTTAPEANGRFVFTAVQPGVYSVSVEKAGFARINLNNLNLTATERLAVGELILRPSSISESVTVTAEGSVVEVESNERSSVITGDQMKMLMSRGGNIGALLNLLPGAVGAESEFERDFFGTHQTPSFGGVPNTANSIKIDGMAGNDVTNPNFQINPINMNAIAEVKVLLSNYKAEYAGNGGVVMVAVSRTGSQSLHGAAYSSFRNEALNANNFFNNQNSVARARYRFSTFGGNLTGPVYIPGKFNRNRDKLFFFFSEDVNRADVPGSLVQYTMPTALERSGDFSQTVDLNGNRVSILDPQANRTAFPGNLIPRSRINPNGQKMLGLFPLPNFFDIAISRRNYNYNFQETVARPTRQELLRLDYNATSKVRLFFRGLTYVEGWEAYNIPGNATWPFSRNKLLTKNPSVTASVTWTVTPTVVMEAAIGLSGTRELLGASGTPDFSYITRATTGINLPQLFPGNNPLNIVPFATFGGVTGAASMVLRQDFPDRQWGSRIPANGNVTKVAGAHTLKAGLSAERARVNRRSNALFSGQFDFNRDSNNPFDSNWAYSNALLGNFRSYTESANRPNYDMRGIIAEWYAQDSWKATRRLSLDYGMRFTYFTPYKQANDIGANFISSLYDRSKQVALFRPALDGKNARVAQNPLTGELAPVSYIGGVVPNSGNTRNGMVFAADPSTPGGFVENRGVHFGPRLGFAYDLTGNGKTAVRAGFGMSYQMQSTLRTYTVDNMQVQPTIFNGSFDTFNPGAGITFPITINALDPKAKTPTVYSYSAGIQRAVGFGTVVDVAYVATLSRQFTQTQNLNTLPYGTRFLASNIDYTTKRVLADDFLRGYQGYTNVNLPRTSTSNYHSLQAQVNRRFARGLQFGTSYAWAKNMGYTGAYPVYLSNQLNHGKTSLDRTHTLTINWLADVPRASRVWNVAAVRAVFDGWQMSGVSTFQSGRPWTVGYSLVSGQDIAGGGDWTRPLALSDATLGHGERTFSRFFNTDAFAPPALGTTGNAPVDVFRGPGRNNFDTSIFKTFKLEKTRLQFRWELFNALNHPSFYGIDNTARFDPQGKQVNTRFGQLTSALAPRIMKVSLNLSF